MPTPPITPRPGLDLEYPRSLGVYDDYAEAQRVVDYLSDQEFAVVTLAIVGTDLKSVERVTGRITRGKVAAAGALSGFWMGLFVGIASPCSARRTEPASSSPRRCSVPSSGWSTASSGSPR